MSAMPRRRRTILANRDLAEITIAGINHALFTISMYGGRLTARAPGPTAAMDWADRTALDRIRALAADAGLRGIGVARITAAASQLLRS